MRSATAFLPIASASIRSLAMPGLAGTLKDKKYSSLSSKLELKGLVKPETASSTHSTLHLFPSADLFKKGCCQLQAKVCAQITG